MGFWKYFNFVLFFIDKEFGFLKNLVNCAGDGDGS